MHKRFLAAAAVAAAGWLVPASGRAAELGANTTLGALVFADVSSITQRQAGTEVAPTGFGFDIKRAYLIVNHQFDQRWAANLITDSYYISSGASVGGGTSSISVHHLYLRFTVNRALALRAGAYGLPWTIFETVQYGNRYIDSSLVGRLGFTRGSDWGLHANGAVGERSQLSYRMSLTNGGGSLDPSRSRDVDLEGAVLYSPIAGLNLGAGAFAGHLGKVTAETAHLAQHTARRWDVLAAWTTPRARLGITYFDATDYKAADPATGVLSGPSGVVVAMNATATDPTGSVPSDEASGYSAWASYRFLARWSAFGRYDHANLSRRIDPLLTDTYFNLGVAYEPIPPIDLALVVKHDTVSHGTITVGGGNENTHYTIGGTGLAGSGTRTSGQFDEIGLYLQYRFGLGAGAALQAAAYAPGSGVRDALAPDP